MQSFKLCNKSRKDRLSLCKETGHPLSLPLLPNLLPSLIILTIKRHHPCMMPLHLVEEYATLIHFQGYLAHVLTVEQFFMHCVSF